MSKAWPADRLFVDKDRKIVDPWLGPLKRLQPLLSLEPSDITALLALIQAAANASADDPFSLNAALAALSVDAEPLESEDFFITFKNADSKGRRVLLSTLLSGLGSTSISTTQLSGSSTVDIVVPSGYRDVEVRVTAMSMSTTANPQISYSEDGGSTFLSQLYQIFTQSFDQSGTTTNPTFTVSTGLSASIVISGVSTIRDYGSSLPKLAVDAGMLSTSGSAWVGSRYMGASTAPINLVRFVASSGTFDAGQIELIGLP